MSGSLSVFVSGSYLWNYLLNHNRNIIYESMSAIANVIETAGETITVNNVKGYILKVLGYINQSG